MDRKMEIAKLEDQINELISRGSVHDMNQISLKISRLKERVRILKMREASEEHLFGFRWSEEVKK